MALNGGVGLQALSTNWGAAAGIMPSTCAFDALYVKVTPVNTIGGTLTADTLTVTLYKNQVATQLTVTVTSSTTLFTSVNGSDTNPLHAVSVGPNDEVALGVVGTDGDDVVRMTVTTRCM
jgi:hypothetical protein